jgi:hypothetical protein
MGDGGRIRLVGKVEVHGGEAGGGAEDAITGGGVLEGFSTIPHHRAEKGEIGRPKSFHCSPDCLSVVGR